MSSSDSGLKADTYGWDTAFGIRVTDVNASIKRKKTSPKSFEGTTKDPNTNHLITVTGDFSDWKITQGGSGKLIHMETPVTGFTAKGKGRNGDELTFTYGPGRFVIEVELEYVPHTDPPKDGSGTFHNLKVKHTADGGQKEVTVMGGYGFGTSTSDPKTPYSAIQDDVEAAMQNWFNAHLIDFEHVFATVNLNRTADKGQFAWLLPTYTSYAYIDHDTLDDSILGILCMTENRSADGLVQEISPNVIPKGSRAGFLIAPHRFVQDMVLPSMPLVYKGVSTDDFALKTDKAGLSLANGPITIPDLKDKSNGKSYKAELKNFELSTSDGALTIDATTRVTVSPHIWAFTQHIASYDLALHTTKEGKQTIFYKAKGKPTSNHWTEHDATISDLTIWEAIIAALITILVGILTGGAGFAIAALITGILVGIASKIPGMIEAANTDDSPAIDLLAFNAVDPLQWSDQKDFNLDQVSLNYSVQMGGTPKFGE
ncbi:MAG: TULIP family P47-like protein [Bacteroidota bacterium]